MDKIKTIEFFGFKSRNELRELYKKCKFIIVPSEWYENAGLIIFEAFAYGKCVIGVDIGGIPEFVKHNERGLIFNSGNSEELRMVIKYLLDNPDITIAMGEKVKTFIGQKFNLEIHYGKLMEIYNNVIENNIIRTN